MGRWVLGALQWRLHKSMLRARNLNRDLGVGAATAQEEGESFVHVSGHSGK